MSSSSSSSSRRVRCRHIVHQHYSFSSVIETPHYTISSTATVYAPTGYNSHLNFTFSSQNSLHITPNYHPYYNSIEAQYHNYYQNGYNVEEQNNGVFEGPNWVQQDEVMITDAIELPLQNPVSTDDGLSRGDISKCLKTRKGNNEDDGSEICSICRDGLLCEDDDVIGVLNCGHKYHVNCIKKWLGKKNLCPLCKSTGLSID